jgi:hypothetical protein
MFNSILIAMKSTQALGGNSQKTFCSGGSCLLAPEVEEILIPSIAFNAV